MLFLQPLLCVAALVLPDEPAQRSAFLAVTKVRLETTADAPLHTIVMRDGVIVEVLTADQPLPPEARVHDAEGKLALPAFVDAWSGVGIATPTPVADRDEAPDTEADAPASMRVAWRRGIQPSVRAAVLYAPDKKDLAKHREAGFGALAAAPSGQYLAGRACVVTTREAAARDVVVAADVYDCASFDAPGGGYPSTLMGSIAHLRQFFLDATAQRAWVQRAAAGKAGPRPPFDPELTALEDALAGRRRLAFEVSSADDVERALRLCAEFGFQPLVLDARGARMVAAQLGAQRVPVILSLDWGDEAEDPAKAERKATEGEDAAWTYEEPLRAREDARRRWLERRDTALALRDAGVSFAFSTRGVEPKTVLERVRTLVAAGLPVQVAERALTTEAAKILGLETAVGSLTPGKVALVALWSAHPLLDDKAQLHALVVEDALHRFEVKVPKSKSDSAEPAPKSDSAAGAWVLQHTVKQTRLAELTVTLAADGAAEGVLRFESKEPLESLALQGTWKDGVLALQAKVDVAGAPVEARVQASLKDNALQGEFTWVATAGTTVDPFVAARLPKRQENGQ